MISYHLLRWAQWALKALTHSIHSLAKPTRAYTAKHLKCKACKTESLISLWRTGNLFIRSMLKTARLVLIKPFNYYSSALDTNPLTTKCLTSGMMYAGNFVLSSIPDRAHQLYQLVVRLHPNIAKWFGTISVIIDYNSLPYTIQLLGGDLIAQFGENYHDNIARLEDGNKEVNLVVDWKRAGTVRGAVWYTMIAQSPYYDERIEIGFLTCGGSYRSTARFLHYFLWQLFSLWCFRPAI